MRVYWSVCTLFTALAITAAAGAAPPSAMERAAEMILRHQASDGAIVMGALPAKRSHVIPYFANFAARGLVAAYAHTGNARFLDGARRWTLWDGKRQVYAVGLDGVGARVRSPESWYPHVMANLMAIGWLPRSPRHVALLRRLKQKHRAEIPKAVRTEEDLGRLVWWGIAAEGAGDEELLQTLSRELRTFDDRMKSLPRPDVLGHLCRILAGGPRPAGQQPSRPTPAP